LSKKFKGRIKDLEEYVYEYLTPSQAAQEYETTTRELAGYIGWTFVIGADIKRVIETKSITAFAMPVDLPAADEASKVKYEIWQSSRDVVLKRTTKLEENMAKAYIVFWGQCSEAVMAKVKSLTDYETMSETYGLVRLLEAIQEVQDFAKWTTIQQHCYCVGGFNDTRFNLA
jgi:poly(3-hydroxyalkanoate) synthetase